MKPINHHAKAEHFAELASRAAYASAVALSPADREAWGDRAALYDAQAAACRMSAKRAA